MEKLKSLALKMKNDARRDGKAQQSLSNGLTLTVRYLNVSDTWVLSLTRRDVRASDNEETMCREVFGVPASCQREPLVRQPYQITRFTWRDPVAVQTELIPGIKPLSRYE